MNIEQNIHFSYNVDINNKDLIIYAVYCFNITHHLVT